MITSSRETGFTLFELLIVLVILGFISGGVAVAVSTSSSGKRIENEGKVLFAQMQFALDEALMRQRIMGLRIDEEDNTWGAYSWHYYGKTNYGNKSDSDKKWQALDGEPLSSVSLTEGIEIDATVDNVLLEALLEQSLNELGDEIASPPAIIFYPNGDVSEFTLVLSFVDKSEGEQVFRIFIDERGQLSNSIIENQ